jgi:hypothetical protein
VFIFILFCHVADISQEMAINSYDIVSTLQALGMMKYWKGKHIILKKQASLFLFCSLLYPRIRCWIVFYGFAKCTLRYGGALLFYCLCRARIKRPFTIYLWGDPRPQSNVWPRVIAN